MRAVVTGSHGMLGREVVRALSDAGAEVTPLRPCRFTVPRGTDLVVHCGAMTDSAACSLDPYRAKASNASWPTELAYSACDRGARLVHISTVAVYDATCDIPHHETAVPVPRTIYAQTKLEGERGVLAAHDGAVALRVMIYGRTTAQRRIKVAEKILRALRTGEPMGLRSGQTFSPICTYDLADIILKLAGTEVRGLLNIGSRDTVDQLTFGRTLAAAYGLDDACLYEEPSPIEHLEVDATKAMRLLGYLPSVDEGIARFSACEALSPTS